MNETAEGQAAPAARHAAQDRDPVARSAALLDAPAGRSGQVARPRRARASIRCAAT